MTSKVGISPSVCLMKYSRGNRGFCGQICLQNKARSWKFAIYFSIVKASRRKQFLWLQNPFFFFWDHLPTSHGTSSPCRKCWPETILPKSGWFSHSLGRLFHTVPSGLTPEPLSQILWGWRKVQEASLSIGLLVWCGASDPREMWSSPLF